LHAAAIAPSLAGFNHVLQLVGASSDEDQVVHIKYGSYPIEVISRIDFFFWIEIPKSPNLNFPWDFVFGLWFVMPLHS